MAAAILNEEIERGEIPFSIESRIVRELGERLVKQPEVALLELIKNSYDADATTCEITVAPAGTIVIADDGRGMTLAEFKRGWMRIGTSEKEGSPVSETYGRLITGEKGIGRFAVRFLGKRLKLESFANDPALGFRTKLEAAFDWPSFDAAQDLGQVRVPYRVVRDDSSKATGTRLSILERRPAAANINFTAVRTASISVVTPYQALLRRDFSRQRRGRPPHQDPGFQLRIVETGGSRLSEDGDVATAVLESFVLRAVIELVGTRLRVEVYRRGEDQPLIRIVDTYPNSIGSLYGDLRFFPKRKGTFRDLPVDGRRAKGWLADNSGVAVFDRTFRVLPYGTPGDDWLFLSADAAKRARDPRSSLAKKHLAMDEATKQSTQLNYMLKLPHPAQLVGVIQVEGRRSSEQRAGDEGLVAAADREGFLENTAFRQLRDIARGAVEAIAAADRELTQVEERREQQELLAKLRAETRQAIREIEENTNIAKHERARIVKVLAETQAIAQEHQERSQQREATLEVMSLLGVVAGFMTHEFGTALNELERAYRELTGVRGVGGSAVAESLKAHIDRLKEFVAYSQGYIHASASRPEKAYASRPRLMQVVRVFGRYASDRGIDVEIRADSDLEAPLVPVSLYNGLALNLFTNALKAVTAKSGPGARKIEFRARNEDGWHFLEVADTGIGIPSSLRERVFEPLFTTTAKNKDPLGSGMGLGLSLVRRAAESFGGRAEVVDPPDEFSTCVQVRLPLTEED